jgi:hypothetical protein
MFFGRSVCRSPTGGPTNNSGRSVRRARRADAGASTCRCRRDRRARCDRRSPMAQVACCSATTAFSPLPNTRPASTASARISGIDDPPILEMDHAVGCACDQVAVRDDQTGAPRTFKAGKGSRKCLMSFTTCERHRAGQSPWVLNRRKISTPSVLSIAARATQQARDRPRGQSFDHRFRYREPALQRRPDLASWRETLFPI